MKRLNITEKQLNKLIVETVKKHINESEEEQDHAGLLREYVNTSLKFLERIKNFTAHPDTNFMLQDDETAFHMAKAVLENASELHKYLKNELGTFKPKKEFKPEDYSEPVNISKKDLALNERNNKRRTE